jgi:hypothetical protein
MIPIIPAERPSPCQSKYMGVADITTAVIAAASKNDL